jgi:branched-chain amino acid transport system permease protein
MLGWGLNIVVGLAGLLDLGYVAFYAVGAYAYALIATKVIPVTFPELGVWAFWICLPISGLLAALWGILLGFPVLRLRGDYLAIVTLGFGEIAQDVLKNLDAITKGTQGINPLPPPSLPLVGEFGSSPAPWYWLFLAITVLAVFACRNLERSRTGRAWLAVREDELAASCMGIAPIPVKMYAFATGAALAAIAGGMWASLYASTGEPGNYDFQISILALCIVIVGGMGSINGVLVGALAMIGVANIALPKLASWLQQKGVVNASNVLGSPNNWKYLVFGLVLVVMMRVRPDGLLPARLERRKAGGSA